MRLAYVMPPKAYADSNDGGDIFHRKLLRELRQRCEEVEEVTLTRGTRHRRLPLWSERADDDSRALIARHADAGRHVVVAHENIFDLAAHGAAHGAPVHLIVHNYFPRFRFEGNPLLGLAYRAGARRYYDRAFAAAQSVFFVGACDHEAAVRLHRRDGERVARFGVAPIPPAPLDVDYRFDPTLLHHAGSEQWLPKRLSRLDDATRSRLEATLRVTEHTAAPQSGFTLIADRFDVGFKLKLMQGVYLGDCIVSRVDLGRELRALSPDYRWYRTYRSTDELSAILADRALHADMDDPARPRLARAVGEAHTWERYGRTVERLWAGRTDETGD